MRVSNGKLEIPPIHVPASNSIKRILKSGEGGESTRKHGREKKGERERGREGGRFEGQR